MQNRRFEFMNRFSLIILVNLLLIGSSVYAQQYPLAGVVNVSALTDDYYPNMVHLEAPKPGTNSYRNFLELQKESIPPKLYLNGQGTTTRSKKSVPRPFQLRNFDGNAYNGIPNDNHLAISNAGTIISVINSTMVVYDEDGNKIEATSLNSFTSELNISQRKYDPRVMYDPAEDKFVLVCLAGRTDSTTHIVLGFSQTNDPTGNWNLYEIPGNPLDDTSWSDYPMLSISDQELIITMNLLKNGGTWQESFKQSVIWQVNKIDGYEGRAIDTRLWDNVEYDGKKVRNLCPVKGGSGNMGSTMYFLSNRNFDLTNDTTFFFTLNGYLDDDNTSLTVQPLIADSAYGVPPAADQPFGVLQLQTNDARVLDAFLENDQILFVGNSVYDKNNFAAFYFGHINNVSSSPALDAQQIGSDSLEFGYPGIAYTGNSSDEMDAIIFVNHSSTEHNPGCGVFFYDGSELSNYKYLREGESWINVLGQSERWGDYIGIQRKYDDPGLVWTAGTYGFEGGGIGSRNTYGTWISEVAKYGKNSIAERNSLKTGSVFPNPTSSLELVKISFELQETTYLYLDLYDLNGRLVKHLYEGKTSKGKNLFQFSDAPLNGNHYIIQARNQIGQTLFRKQLIVSD